MNLILNTIANQFKLLPMRAVKIMDFTNSNTIIIHNLESESSYNIKPKTKTNRFGDTIVLGYDVEINIYIPYNNFDSNAILRNIENMKISQMDIELGNAVISSPAHTQPRVINYTASGVLSLFNLVQTIEMESVEFRPRAIMRIKKFLKDLSYTPGTNLVIQVVS